MTRKTGAKRKTYTAAIEQGSPKMQLLQPLTQAQHHALNLPPDTAYVRLMEGNATLSDLWTLWFRVCATRRLLEKHFPQAIEDFIPIAERVDAFFAQHYSQQTQGGIGADGEILLDLNDALELAKEAQTQINRQHLAQTYAEVNDQCKKRAQVMGEQVKKP